METPEEFLVLLRELTARGDDVPLTVTGNSMSPFLRGNRDTVVLSSINRPLKRGDIVFYLRENGSCILHRIKRIKKNGYFFVGDAQTAVEGPVGREQLLAVVTAVVRDGERLSSGDAKWNFYKYVWIRLVRLRPVIVKIYSKIKARQG